MLLLLGDQLIRDAGLAVFELVKNAYDADATECVVTLRSIGSPDNGSIVVQDDGSGMDLRTVTGVWLEPGTDFRTKQKEALSRSHRFHRLPLGEKGVGRFAVHKLGRAIELVTRKRGKLEITVSIDWQQFDRGQYLSQVPVEIRSREPEVFKGNRSGTRIVVSELRDRNWTRGKVRDLYRSISSICSPFDKPTDFQATLKLTPANDWLDGLLDAKNVLEHSLFRITGMIRGDQLSYTYRFHPLATMREHLAPRAVTRENQPLMRISPKGQRLDLEKWRIGTVKFSIHIFDREPAVLDLFSADKAGLKKFLDQNGGIRVYRDGIRVFDFGEPGNDWLGLGGRRVNIPTVRISNNQVIAAVSLVGGESDDLVEKTNREGFIENDAYEAFREAILFTISQIEAERRIDKTRLRKQYSRGAKREPVLDDLAELREEIERRHLTDELGGYINRIESQFADVRDRLMTAAGAGLTLTTVIHEVEKIIKEIVQAVKRSASQDRIRALVDHLSTMVEGLSFLVRKSGKSTESLGVLLKQAAFNVEYRLRAHRIALELDTESRSAEVQISCVRRLIVSTLMNLVDNSIFWLENKGDPQKRIYMGARHDPVWVSFIVADNGPGFIDPPEYLVEPFFTRKPDGMGLGLHLANEVAKLHGGRLEFPDSADSPAPKAYGGAVVVLKIPRQAK
jgi:signal transduction histidine kinase